MVLGGCRSFLLLVTKTPLSSISITCKIYRNKIVAMNNFSRSLYYAGVFKDSRNTNKMWDYLTNKEALTVLCSVVKHAGSD